MSYKVLGCCGPKCSPQTAQQQPPQQEDENEPQREREEEEQPIPNEETQSESAASPLVVAHSGRNPAMDLCPAKTLRKLFEETDDVDLRNKKAQQDHGWMCCVCMDNCKGAAFVPCGHAFCRVCSTELFVNRGSCPICNRSIIHFLDIF